jgi:hypothetical protein
VAQQTVEPLQRFRPTNGRVTGILGIVVCVAVAVALAVSEPPHVAVPGVLACAFVAVLVWLAMLRPSVSASDTELRLRTLFETVTIPLASVETVVVRRYLLVRSGGEKYICPAISRSLRKTVRAEMRWKPQQMLSPSASVESLGDGLTTRPTVSQQEQDLAYADFVEQRIQQLADNDRSRLGIEARSEEEYALGERVVRRVAWAELGLLAALAVAFVIAVVV